MRRMILAALGAVLALALTGCVGERQESATEVTYRAWTERGDLEAIQYYTDDPFAGALVLPVDDIDGSTWSETIEGGTSPRVTVTPDDEAIANCQITDSATTNVLDRRSGEPGEPVTCRAVRRGR